MARVSSRVSSDAHMTGIPALPRVQFVYQIRSTLMSILHILEPLRRIRMELLLKKLDGGIGIDIRYEMEV